ncbi:amidase [Pseudosulfitobacter pseudonitzschiae]|uniref:Amidase n=1 Tax=Pseudosulfitobacter pseudonitzschiae TaxID=1402135 RepID=A0A073J7U3_9RHOB|nr:amidase [Pseudosulfitobacter pseudonitzschiae]KEJ97781.1 amidase [Pseudosulfitobacter pseudonitzschiae]QKS09046.1 amidase [Pseudosulfitobacter pseudonitzschiae]SHE58033.1 amidase [Pseudosulfitobacter pseudonitzschiae]
MTDDILFQGALAQSDALAKGTLTATDLMQATLARIDAVNGAVNAVVSLRDADDLMAEARAADAAPRSGWLHGMPIAIKDLANAAGLPTSMGSPLFAGQVAAKDDIMVARLRAAGAIVIGKTNTPEFGLGSHTINPVHGPTHNPYAHGRSAGGSSGGAAAALACGMLSVADGSDMMGSLRNPAGWNNVYGMRPTWGLVPSEPEGDSFLHQLATNGPMARNPADLAALLDTIAGPDPRQPHGLSQAPALPQIAGGMKGVHIGWLGNWGGALPMEPGILEISQAALQQMEGLGAQVTDQAPLFDADAMWDSWITLRSWQVGAGLAAVYNNPAQRDYLKDTAQWEIGRGIALSGMQVHAASLVRSNWFKVAAKAFETYDVLALPSAQLWPFEITWDYPREVAGVQMDTYHRWMQVVVPASLLGLPVVNVPVGFGGPDDAPAGLQLIGKRGSDAALLRVAQAWHAATDWPNARRV